ncbi:ELWxxDGT repeat protein [Lacipirellula sp.]|uniref:ELWxxDGT repeat protein n=1 Tax=Lacipirellula sp. TaxID=2691419 RepID=UPI003D0CB9BE
MAVESLEDRRMLAIDFGLIEDINTAGLPLQIGKPTSLTKVGETVFFTTERISFSDRESLWKIDPTTHEALLLKTFSASSDGILNLARAVEFNGSLYFTANDGASGFELWKSDGTAAGTALVKDTIAGVTGGSPTSLTNANGVLYFVVSDGSTTPSRPIQLWKSDGTTAGTTAVTNIGNSLGTIGVGDSYTKVTRSITAVGSEIYFVANGTGGVELWRSDGAATAQRRHSGRHRCGRGHPPWNARQ